MPLDQFVEARITRPLGMTATGFAVPEASRDRIAQPQPNPTTGQAVALFDPLKKPARLSGGGGAVSTASDYLRLCEMFLNGGQREGTRILAPSTVALMTANALRPGSRYSPQAQRSTDSAPTPALGQGFGLGFSVRLETGQNPLPGAVGSYYWSGAYGTTFYIDPKEKLILIMMMQAGLGTTNQFRHAVRYLTYQAMVPQD
jgi:CubicO group peptidase (beta-lactamase class C family)